MSLNYAWTGLERKVRCALRRSPRRMLPRRLAGDISTNQRNGWRFALQDLQESGRRLVSLLVESNTLKAFVALAAVQPHLKACFLTTQALLYRTKLCYPWLSWTMRLATSQSHRRGAKESIDPSEGNYALLMKTRM